MTRGVIMVMMENSFAVREEVTHMDHYLRQVIPLDAV